MKNLLLFLLLTGTSFSYAAPSFIGHVLMSGNQQASHGQGLGLLLKMSSSEIKLSPLRACSGACLKMRLKAAFKADIYFKEVNLNIKSMEPRLEISLSTVSKGVERYNLHSKVISEIYKILSDYGADTKHIWKRESFTFFDRTTTGVLETVYIPESVIRTIDIGFLDEIADRLAAIR